MINYVVLVIPTGKDLCIEADSYTTGLTFCGQLGPATVFTGLDTDPVEFTPHLHNRAVIRYVIFMLPSVSTFLKWSSYTVFPIKLLCASFLSGGCCMPFPYYLHCFGRCTIELRPQILKLILYHFQNLPLATSVIAATKF
jgi:hypothetical protein